MHLFQDFVDVDGVRFLSPLLPFLVTSTDGLSLSGFFGSFGRNFGRHDDFSIQSIRVRVEKNPFIAGATTENSSFALWRFEAKHIEEARRAVNTRLLAVYLAYFPLRYPRFGFKFL